MTPDQLRLGIRLESIFMPYARQQRDKAYKRQTGLDNGWEPDAQPIKFVHYTSADAALKIIRTKRMWMRNTNCMTDYREVTHGFDILRKFFSDNKIKEFCTALDTCAPGAALKAIDLFNAWWRNQIPFNTYILSISEHDQEEEQHGRLSMWRAFGGASARVALVFKLPWYSGAAEALNIIFSPVAYLEEKQALAVLDSAIGNVRAEYNFLKDIDRTLITGVVFNMLLAGVTCLKHEGFREEREWRVIYSPGLRSSSLIESSVEVIQGVPQMVYKLPLDKSVSPDLAAIDLATMFDKIIIGPSSYPVVMMDAFKFELAKVGVTDVNNRVMFSGIPIRS